jgi:hypothetical protein
MTTATRGHRPQAAPVPPHCADLTQNEPPCHQRPELLEHRPRRRASPAAGFCPPSESRRPAGEQASGDPDFAASLRASHAKTKIQATPETMVSGHPQIASRGVKARNQNGIANTSAGIIHRAKPRIFIVALVRRPVDASRVWNSSGRSGRLCGAPTSSGRGSRPWRLWPRGISRPSSRES